MSEASVSSTAPLEPAAPPPGGFRGRLAKVTGGDTTTPLLLLFALNLVDEFDQVTFGVLAPEIRDTFGTSEATITTLAAFAGALVILLIVPVGVLADRYNRVHMSAAAAFAWGTMSILTGLSGFTGVLALLFVARFGAGLGRVMNEPVHASLLADYYPPSSHGRIFSFHQMANPIGLMLVLAGGLLADVFGWRLTFLLLSIPTFIIVAFVTRLKEPIRGASINASLAAQAEQAGGKVPFGEAFRRLSGIRTLKRCWIAGFLLGAAVVPITTFFAFFFEKVYGVTSAGPWGRAGIIAFYGLGSIFGLILASRWSDAAINAGEFDKLAVRGGYTLIAVGGALLAVAVAPVLPLSIAFTFVVGLAGSGFLAYHLPLVALVAPPRLRSQAFGWFGFWFGMGAVTLSAFVGRVGENQGYRWGIGVLAVAVSISGLIYLTSKRFVKRDVEQAFNALSAEVELAEALSSSGSQAVLTCKGVEVAYDQVQVLFGVDMVVREGEIVALLGTNGAGKSTILKAVSGLVDPIGGAIFFEGRDVTHADAVQTTKLGIVQVPGGKAIFPTLTVTEHLRAASWLFKKEPQHVKDATEEVFKTFPRLKERSNQLAGDLSGGEQQMLALGMAFIAKPKLLCIDELSLGLAPTIVEQLLVIVRRIRDEGTAIILVEQSLNVALTIADRAYFLEKGEVRFEGSTEELAGRDDIVRSVFLEGATKPGAAGTASRTDAVVTNADGEVEPPKVILEAKELVMRFGGVRAVDDTSLVLHEHEILGLIGANGAGKTTIFDLISGFLTPTSGKVFFGGRDVTNLSPDARAWLGLGRSFQDARLMPSLTVTENLAIGLERHLTLRDHVASTLALPGVLTLEEDVAWSVQDLIELMNLGAFRDKFVRELSTGSRRVVDLAMCIAHDPDVLLLDEPAAGIAQRETEALGPLLKRIQAEAGCAILLIEHDMPLITGISDRMVALELGHPIAEGTPDEVINDPRVVSSYLGGDMAVINRSGKAGTTPEAKPKRRRAPLVAAGKETQQ